MANLCCTIEMEPRTLNQGQLHHAREIAVDIVQNKETDEAATIFNGGLTPMVAIKEDAVVMVVSNSNQPRALLEIESVKEVVETELNVGTCCRCSRNANTTDDRLDESRTAKEPLSAPF